MQIRHDWTELVNILEVIGAFGPDVECFVIAHTENIPGGLISELLTWVEISVFDRWEESAADGHNVI